MATSLRQPAAATGPARICSFASVLNNHRGGPRGGACAADAQQRPAEVGTLILRPKVIIDYFLTLAVTIHSPVDVAQPLMRKVGQSRTRNTGKGNRGRQSEEALSPPSTSRARRGSSRRQPRAAPHLGASGPAG